MQDRPAWCDDRNRFDEIVASLRADMVNESCISRISGISMQVMRECGTDRPLHKATTAKLQAALPELERIRTLPPAERLAEVGGGYVDPTWFDDTIASLRRRGLTDSYIARESGLTTGVLRRCGDNGRRLYLSAAAKLATSLEHLEHTAARPEPSKSIEMGLIWEMPCPQCGKRFSPASPDDLFCSPSCRHNAERNIPPATVPIDHDTLLGDPSATAYAKGCRCTACAAAQAASAQKVRAKKGDVWGDVRLARRCIEVLLGNGWTLSELHRMTGIRPATLASIRDGKTQKVKAATAATLLDVVKHPGHRILAHNDVTAEPLREILAGWKSSGLAMSYVSRKTGLSEKLLSAIMTGSRTQVKAATVGKLLSKRRELDEIAALPADEQKMETRRTPTRRTCRTCGKPFSATNPKRVYCSEQCKWDWHNRRTSHDPAHAVKVLSEAKAAHMSLAGLARKHGVDRYALYRIANGECSYITDSLYTRLRPLLDEAETSLRSEHR